MKKTELTALLDTLTHDIQSPLASIQAIVSTLPIRLQSSDPQAVNDVKSTLETKLTTVTEEVRTLFLFIRMKEKLFKETYSFFYWHDLENSLKANFPEVLFQDTVDTELFGDRNLIEQIFIWLFAFSIISLAKEKAVEVNSTKKRGGLEVILKFEPNERKKLLQERWSPKLYLAEKILKMHGGNLDIDTHGDEARIVVDLPKKPENKL